MIAKSTHRSITLGLFFFFVSLSALSQEKEHITHTYFLKKSPKFSQPMRIQYNNNCLITFEGSPYLAQIRHFIPDLPTTITHKDTIFIQVQDQFEPGEATLVCQAKDFTNLESDPALSKEIYKWSAEFKKTIVHTLLKKGELGFQKDIHSKPVRTIQKIKTKRYGSTFFIWGNKKQDFYFHKEVMEFFNPQSW